MSYASDLIDQALALCSADKRRPKQANLRRAVSAAYYGLFHELTATSAAALLPARRADLRVPLRREFVHKTMKAVAQAATSCGHAPLSDVATTFVSLQEARHQADYDFSRTFTRFEADDHIESARAAIATWARITSSSEAEQFALELLVGKLDIARG